MISGCCAALSTCATCVSCCSTISSCCQPKKASHSRIQYFMMFIISAFLCWILHDYGYNGLKHVGDMKNCVNADCTGTGIVLRICFAMVLLFSFLCVLLCGVRESSHPRSFLQNDIFPVKWLLLFGIMTASLFLSNESTIEFGYVCSAGAGIFLFIGIVLLLEFAHSWNDSWVEKLDNGDEKFWGRVIIGTAAFLYAVSITAWALLFVYFGGDGCDETTAFLSVTVVMSVLVTALTIPEKIQNGAILPCSVVVLYCTWLCTSAILSIPIDNQSACAARHSKVDATTEKFMEAISLTFTIFCIGYATIRLATSSSSLAASKTQALIGGDVTQGEGGSTSETKTDKDEKVEMVEDIQYNYSFFQLTFALGSMYLAMVLIDWNIHLQTKDAGELGQMSDWGNVWIKMASQWATYLLYIWTLIAPLVFPDRDFS
eukprot:c16750_g2_i3.p1 GENE.c16750_g2_i3~~c16750_g2_i3.p1  ORF type:complete len:444 (+),score=141.69 c16750_g2_i3:44-1333(+)